MNRSDWEVYLIKTYCSQAEHPWAKHPDYTVFRHENSRKWFALIMKVPRARLGLNDQGTLDIVNLKCPPALLGSFLREPGFFPAYHMNKENWISIALDGSVPLETLKTLFALSFDATAGKRRPRKSTDQQL